MQQSTDPERLATQKEKATMTTVELKPISKQSEDTLGIQVDKKTPSQKVPSLCAIRYGIALLAHFANFTLIAQNSIVSITMVAMVNNTDQSHLNSSTEELPGDLNGDQHEASKPLPAEAPVYNWSPQTQGIIFSSVQYGMMLMQGPGGFLAGKIGTKKVVGIALLGSSLLTLLIPLAANLGLGFLLAARAVQGFTQGAGYGGQFALWQRWAPPQERSRLCSIALSGMVLGIFVVLLVGGVIIQALGWPFVFYIFGGFGCGCSLLWFILIYDDPASHPWISSSEKEYILSSLHQQISSEEQQPLPIKAMLRSLPLWTMCLATTTHQWLVNTYIVYIPTYISNVFKVNIRENGFLSSLPFFVGWVNGILGGLLADFLLSKNFRLVTVRKILTVLGTLPSAALIVSLPYIQFSYVTTIAFLTLSCGLAPLSQSGVYINALDIAPRYASLLMGTSRGLAHSSAVLVPIIGGFFLDQDPDLGWRNFFFLLFAVSQCGLIIYLVFGKAEVQEWAKERMMSRL